MKRRLPTDPPSPSLVERLARAQRDPRVRLGVCTVEQVMALGVRRTVELAEPVGNESAYGVIEPVEQ